MAKRVVKDSHKGPDELEIDTTQPDERAAFEAIYRTLEPFDEEAQLRIMRAVAILNGFDL